MKNLKGVCVYWDVESFNCSADDLTRRLGALGYSDYIPRNDYQTATIKGLQSFLKETTGSFYKKVTKELKSSLGPDEEMWIIATPSTQAGSVTITMDIEVRLNKNDGLLSFNPDNTYAGGQIRRLYAENRPMLNSKQFIDIVKSILRSRCEGVAMRRSGGVYYVPKSHFDELTRLREVFALFPENCQLHEIPIYDDESTLVAIEKAVNDDILDDLENLLADLKHRDSGADQDMRITTKVLNSRLENVEALLERVATHREDLRDKADKLDDRAKKIRDVLGRELNKPRDEYSLRDVIDSL